MITQTAKISKQGEIFLDIINQIFEIERKVERLQESNSIQRNVDKLREILESQMTQLFPDSGFVYENPIGQKYDETRTDCNASIAGEKTEDLVIIEVIKPIIRFKQNNMTQIVQKAVVVVQSQE
ncbi:hypothetical protein BCS42_07140 [Crenothrix sp. D3]|nr:hypothetical protein BCS42_07140 [Crenothrix sp. D3]